MTVVLTARTKRQAEEASCLMAWNHLQEEGFVTPESLVPNFERGPRPSWDLPCQKSADNPLSFAEISIGGLPIGQIVMEWFCDLVPMVWNMCLILSPNVVEMK